MFFFFLCVYLTDHPCYSVVQRGTDPVISASSLCLYGDGSDDDDDGDAVALAQASPEYSRLR